MKIVKKRNKQKKLCAYVNSIKLLRVLNLDLFLKGPVDHFNVVSNGVSCHKPFSSLRKLWWQLESRKLDKGKLNLVKILVERDRKE